MIEGNCKVFIDEMMYILHLQLQLVVLGWHQLKDKNIVVSPLSSVTDIVMNDGTGEQVKLLEECCGGLLVRREGGGEGG